MVIEPSYLTTFLMSNFVCSDCEISLGAHHSLLQRRSETVGVPAHDVVGLGPCILRTLPQSQQPVDRVGSWVTLPCDFHSCQMRLGFHASAVLLPTWYCEGKCHAKEHHTK